MSGQVVGIYRAAGAGAPLEPVAEAMLVAGRGIVGDRYYGDAGALSEKLKDKTDRQVTLIESEEIERFNQAEGLSLGAGALRRNIVTRDIRLNDLVGVRFRLGQAVLEGMRLCEPCAYLAKVVTPKVLPGLVHRAGLRAQIVSGGIIRPGYAIVVEAAV